MLAPAILTIWLLILPVITCFEFTAPAPGTSLDLSASSIDITWASDDPQYSQFDLKFKGSSDEGTIVAYTLAQNLSIADGQYTWQPSDVADALGSTKIMLTNGEDYQFQADLYNGGGSSRGASVDSGSYAVTGYQYVGAAAYLQIGVGAVLLTWTSLLIALAV